MVIIYSLWWRAAGHGWMDVFVFGGEEMSACFFLPAFILTLVCMCLNFAADFSFNTKASHRRPFEFINPQIRNVYVCPTWLSITDCFYFMFLINIMFFALILWFLHSAFLLYLCTSLIYTIQMKTFNEVIKRLGTSSTSSDCFWNRSWLK